MLHWFPHEHRRRTRHHHARARAHTYTHTYTHPHNDDKDEDDALFTPKSRRSIASLKHALIADKTRCSGPIANGVGWQSKPILLARNAADFNAASVARSHSENGRWPT